MVQNEIFEYLRNKSEYTNTFFDCREIYKGLQEQGYTFSQNAVWVGLFKLRRFGLIEGKTLHENDKTKRGIFRIQTKIGYRVKRELNNG